jgi:ABC-type amino acid transport substrate-binding protein
MGKITINICTALLYILLIIPHVCATSQLTPELRVLLSAPDIQVILQRKKLIVAMTKQDNVPFYMVDEKGKLIGYDVELAKSIAMMLGVNVEFNRNNETFDDVIYMVAKGNADIGISKLSLTLGRAQVIRYTKPYIVLNKALLINRISLKKHGSNQSLNHLFGNKGATIGSITRSSYQEFTQGMFPNASVFTGQSWDKDIIPKLLKGEILGAFRDELVVRTTLINIPSASIYLLAVIIQNEPDPIMMAVNQKSDVLQQWLDLYLDYYHPKITIEALIEKYKKYIYTNLGIK